MTVEPIASPGRHWRGRPLRAVRDGAPGRQAARAGGAYTRFVTLMKVVLPAIAICMLALLVAWPRLHDAGTAPAVRDGGQLEMLNARYVGVDEENRPFSVVARRAVRSASEPTIVDLIQPEAEMTGEDGAWIAMTAQRGRYNEQTGKLLLLGEVHLFHDQGYEFRTDEVHVDVSAGQAWGDRPVTGQGPFGELFGQGFRIHDEGRTIVFTGRSRVNLASSGSPKATP